MGYAFVEHRGARLCYRLDGRSEAPPLVLLNSIGTGMNLWSAALSPLSEHFHVLRVDARGHGASTATDGDYNLASLVDDLVAVMNAARIGRALIAGVSLGGMIAMELALGRPERVEGLVLVCTSAAMDHAAWQARIDAVRAGGMHAIADLAMQRFLSDGFRMAQPAVADAIHTGLLATDARGYAGCAAAIRDMDLAFRLGGITCPVLVVAGGKDVSTPCEPHGRLLVESMKGAELAMVDTGHLAPVEAPDVLAQLIVDFSERSSA